MKENLKTIGQMTLAGLCLVGLAACKSSALETSSAGADDRVVELIATAPDGTKLWRYEDGTQRTVYFSSSGTQYSVSCGKGCNRTEVVPNAGPQ